MLLAAFVVCSSWRLWKSEVYLSGCSKGVQGQGVHTLTHPKNRPCAFVIESDGCGPVVVWRLTRSCVGGAPVVVMSFLRLLRLLGTEGCGPCRNLLLYSFMTSTEKNRCGSVVSLSYKTFGLTGDVSGGGFKWWGFRQAYAYCLWSTDRHTNCKFDFLGSRTA